MTAMPFVPVTQTLAFCREMSTTTRAIIIDNTDSRVDYSDFPPWFLAKADARGTLSPTLFSPPHETLSNGSLQFKFNGTQIALFGTNVTKGVHSRSGDIDSTWQCFVDDRKIDSISPSKFQELNISEFCQSQNLTDEPHILTLNATREHQPFSVDYISYTPSSKSIPLNTSLIRVSSLDPDIHYSPGWEPLEDVLNVTRRPSSSMSFDFIGQSLSWYGIILMENVTTAPSSASYVIDNLFSSSFTLNSSTPGPLTSSYIRPFFETPIFPFGLHSMQVTFNGTESSTPLTLAFLLIHNVNPTPASNSSTIQATTSNLHADVNIGGIVGGSLGGIFTLLLVAFLFIRCRKQTRKAGTHFPFFSKSVPIETDKASTVSTKGVFALSRVPSTIHHDSHELDPTYHNTQSQTSIQSANLNCDEVDDDQSSYYGGYRTWGQIKAMEAASESNLRDSYM